MSISLDKDQGFQIAGGEQFGLECPHCGVYANMSPQAVPQARDLVRSKPSQVGLVFECNACSSPVFLRFTIRAYKDNRVELAPNYLELERPKEKFSFSYLPEDTEVLFREALSCYSSNNFNAFASMCRRAASSAFEAMGEGGKLQAFDEVMVARDIAGIDDEAFDPIQAILFEADSELDLPLLNRAQAGILLEILKDMFYQCFVRRGKLTRAIKVRQFFVEGNDDDFKSTA
ncbi:MAG: hypothetical protein ACR2QS_01590 [Woeseiaceae bacterium]